MNKFERVLIYARSKDQNELSCSEMYELQDEAFELKPEQLDEIDKILRKHGFTRKQWDEVLNRSRHFWFGDSEDEYRVNCAVKDYLMSIGMRFLANYSINVFSGHLTNAVKNRVNPKIGRRHDGKVFKYYLL